MLANEIDRLGLECNESGWVIAWMMECFERGLLTAKDLDGLEMRWGNAEAAKALLHKIARREGVGELLAEGVKRAAHQLGGEAAKCAIFTEKGNSPRGHDHRANWSEMLDVCVSGTGTIEGGGIPFREEFGLPPKMDPFSAVDVSTTAGKGNGRLVFQDCLVVCKFTTQIPLAKIAELVNAATGWGFSGEDCLAVGRRIVNLLRVHNLRCGITAAVERPSMRYGSTPVDGPVAGKSIAPVWDEMLRNYYGLMGWDQENGKPLPETLRRYGLQHTIPYVWSQAEVEAREGK
jgi:aldehyde:ferredoxin oxidoreductase